MRSSTFLSLISSFIFSVAFATGEAPSSFTLDGRLYADAAATTPLTDPDTKIVLQILNATQDCILYEETQPHFDLQVGNGYFTLKVGSAVGAGKRSALDSAHSMSVVYSNTGVGVTGRTFGGSACNYSPNPGDSRYIRLIVTPSSDNVARILSPNMTLDSVPNAIVAERAESVQGLGAANILQVNTSGSEVLSQTNLENIFTSSNYTALTGLLAGSSSLYSKPAANGTTPLANVSSPASPAAGQIWYDSGAIKFYDGSSTQTLGTAGAGISSVVAGTGLNVGAGPGGTITSTGTLNVDTGTTTGKIVQVAASNKLPVIDGSNLTNLTGSAISGTIGGSTAVNTSGALTTSGNITGATVTGTSVVGTTGSFGSTSTGQLSLYDNAVTNTNYVTLKTPNTATLTADYTLTLPSALPGSSGQVLTSDTSGNLTWSSPSSGSVVSVGGTAPITVTGTASAPIVNVSAATTGASGVVTLAANGGTTASTVVQATDSRLSDSRAPSGGASGDLSGTYPSPTVAKLNGVALSISSLTSGDHLKYNGTNWINAALSSADLSNDSNLLKASNMPANCAAGSSLTFSSPTGTWVCTTIPDATASSKGIMQVGAGLAVSSGTVSLTSGIVTAGTYPKVTVDTYGRVTAGAALASGDVTTALGFTPVNKAGDIMTGAFGLQSITTATETTLVGGYTAADKGKMWFNSDLKKIHMWDGTAIESISSPPVPTVAQDGQSLRWNNTTKAWDYFTAGAAGAGIGTFNTLSANVQTLATGTSGTAPNWNSTGSTHTLNIPLASSATVTAGLISKTDYDNFNTKVGTSYALAGDVTGTPATTSVDKIKGKTVTTPTTTGQMLVYDGTGITPVVMSNDATMAATGAVTLKNTGTAGTYPKVTTDAQGRVISGTTLSATDIPSLDWAKITSGTPTTLAGYGITDAVKNAGGAPSVQEGTFASMPAAGTAGRLYVSTDGKKLYRDNGTTWDIISPATAGTVTSVTSGGAPIVVGGTATDPTISVSAATTGASGVVTLAADGGTTASTVVQATDARLSNSRAPTGTAGGDLSGTYPNPTVAKINGTGVTYTSLTGGDFLKYNGTNWVNAALSSANLSNDSNLLKSTNMPSSCGADHTLTFSSPTGTWSCTTIAGLDAGAITTGTIAAARLPASATYWQAATGGINYGGGNVGIGTSVMNVYDAVATGRPLVVTASDASTTIGGSSASLAISNSDTTANNTSALAFTTLTGANTNHFADAEIVAIHGARTNGQYNAGQLAFMTAPGANVAPAERLRIDNTGNVGIGTTTPSVKLDVSGTINATAITVNGTPVAGSGEYFSAVDQKTSGSYAGPNTSGVWETRVLNTVRATASFANLASNQVTLNAGTYQIRASCPAWAVSQFKCRWRNITDGTTALVGSSEYIATTNGATGRSWVNGQFTVVGTKIFELQMYSTTVKTTDGLGTQVGSENEIYATLEIWNGNGASGGASNQWNTSGSDIYRTSGNVGIGTATPSQKLEVTGTVKATQLDVGVGSFIQIYLSQCGGPCGSYHVLSSWTNVSAIGYNWVTSVNSGSGAFTHNNAGTITVAKAGTYTVKLYSMAMPTADASYVEYVCPYINGGLSCGIGNAHYQQGYYPAGWWAQKVYTFTMNIPAGGTVQYGYGNSVALTYWAHDAYTAMEVIRVN